MRWGVRVAGVVMLLAGMIGCSGSGGHDALAEARAACGGVSGLPTAPPKPVTGEEWSAAAGEVDGVVQHAALAAQRDARWGRLSNAWTDFQLVLRQRAIVAGSGSFSEKVAAQEAIDRLNLPEVNRTIVQECRKAQAG
ncbi:MULTISPECIES: hypothetical protein [unclassified Streptomyces]|uniref:hypothetical protein n=1 Tax=unclassified Streptomyces TaxID=2593676 RepID=UPI003324E077